MPHIQIHLDGTDFQGFGLRMLSVVGISVGTQWLTGWDGGWIFFCVSLCWVAFLAYKVTTFKENAYTQVIEELEKRHERLQKSNELLQNVVQDKLGMRVKVDDKEAS
jgi:hypothetical protein